MSHSDVKIRRLPARSPALRGAYDALSLNGLMGAIRYLGAPRAARRSHLSVELSVKRALERSNAVAGIYIDDLPQRR